MSGVGGGGERKKKPVDKINSAGRRYMMKINLKTHLIMRKHIVAGNWKMNCTFNEADDLINGIMEQLEQKELPRDTKLIVCPPFP